MTEPLPLRLHRAVSLLSRSGDPGTTDAQVTCAEAAARIVQLENTLIALLNSNKGADDQARHVLLSR